jgi:tetratricopeptide (TPR) repeat protein
MLRFDTHLDEDAAVAFIEGRMSPAERERAELHVDGCTECRRLLSALARAVASMTAGSTASTQDIPPGVRLPRGSLAGRFVVIEQIGAGAMGVVHSAYDPELDRKIALKLLRAHESGDPAGSRILREAQAMARVVHPNVVTVHEVGVAGGRVFVAMEFIDGPTLRGWVRAKQRSVREIIDVFTAVGRGVAAAHAAGVIHRDLKPDNVLIGSDGRPRVTDFGLAHGAEERPADIAGTPAYMAPEQHGGGAIDARVDQYAFCVALYEALYDRLPFDVAHFAKGARRIPAPLRRLLARGLSTHSADRYPSMTALLDELARAPARARLRWIVAGAVFAALALGGGITHRLRAEHPAPCANLTEPVDAVWNPARKDAIASMFRATGQPFAEDAWLATERMLEKQAKTWSTERRTSCEATRIRHQQSPETMALREACFDRRLSELRALTEVFATADATVVEHAVAASGKLVPVSSCANGAELALQPAPPSNPEQWRRVVAIRRRHDEARALLDAGKYGAAMPLVTSVLTDAKETGYLPLRAEAFYLEGGARFFASDGKGAEDALFEAIADAEVAHYDLLAAKAWPLLIAALGHRQGRYDAALLLERPARAALLRAGTPPEWEAALENDIGGTLMERSPAEAGKHFGRAVELYERAFGPDGRNQAIGNQGMAFFLEGRFDEAKDRFERDLALQLKLVGRDHPQTAMAMDRLGLVLQMTGRFDDAEREHARAVAVLERVVGPEHPELGNPLINLGLARLSAGKPKEALPALSRAYAIRAKALPPDHPQIAQSLRSLGIAYDDLGETKKALAYIEKSHAMLLRSLPPDDRAFVDSSTGLASILRELHRYDASLEHAKRAVALAEKVCPPKHLDRFLAWSTRGRTELALGRTTEAVATLERALEERRPGVGDPIDEGDVEIALARALVTSGKDRARARRLAEDARRRFSVAGSRAAHRLAEADTWLRAHGQRSL